ncbi:uncharacterized protein LOC124647898 [Lolium rigidum]|uniref:uncharacterized protein LOC124647898 n=1 Tax=Lolium rigidum TaxID=89674 RepID=UPI001F5C3C83|nr:uncharacterized protein LOC124647898 [Lolium rigidum]
MPVALLQRLQLDERMDKSAENSRTSTPDGPTASRTSPSSVGDERLGRQQPAAADVAGGALLLGQDLLEQSVAFMNICLGRDGLFCCIIVMLSISTASLCWGAQEATGGGGGCVILFHVL